MVRDPAIVLLSGGLDSTCTLAIAMAAGHPVIPLTVSYGQRHAREIVAAQAICAHLGLTGNHRVLTIPTEIFQGSALTDPGIPVPTIGGETGTIPVTYVPARNTIMLSLALALAESSEADHVYIGANAVDYSGYPDCRPEYLAAFETMANLATKRAVSGQHMTIHAPLMSLTKAEIITRAQELGAPLHLSWSCYTGGERPCEVCDSCRIRASGFMTAGIPDPARTHQPTPEAP